MNYPEVTHLYKYTDSIKRAKQMVEDEMIWYSKVSSFNDPFEGIFEITHDIPPEDIIALAIKFFSEGEHNWSEISKRIMNDVVKDDFGGLPIKDEFQENLERSVAVLVSNSKESGVLSLSENPLNILMWSHYANEHKGFCIEFERTIDDPLGDETICRPVVYSRKYPNPSVNDILRGENTLADKMAFTKSTDWAYEKEWRVLNDKGNSLHPIPGRATKIILGAKWSGSYSEMLDLAAVNDVSLYQAQINSGRYSLSMRDITHKHYE